MRILLGVLASLAVASAQIGSDKCSDSCRHTFDGDCDDGGPGAEYALCSFGTDCTDCEIRSPVAKCRLKQRVLRAVPMCIYKSGRTKNKGRQRFVLSQCLLT